MAALNSTQRAIVSQAKAAGLMITKYKLWIDGENAIAFRKNANFMVTVTYNPATDLYTVKTNKVTKSQFTQSIAEDVYCDSLINYFPKCDVFDSHTMATIRSMQAARASR
jgi:hypothetical protein